MPFPANLKSSLVVAVGSPVPREKASENSLLLRFFVGVPIQVETVKGQTMEEKRLHACTWECVKCEHTD